MPSLLRVCCSVSARLARVDATPAVVDRHLHRDRPAERQAVAERFPSPGVSTVTTSRASSAVSPPGRQSTTWPGRGRAGRPVRCRGGRSRPAVQVAAGEDHDGEIALVGQRRRADDPDRDRHAGQHQLRLSRSSTVQACSAPPCTERTTPSAGAQRWRRLVARDLRMVCTSCCGAHQQPPDRSGERAEQRHRVEAGAALGQPRPLVAPGGADAVLTRSTQNGPRVSPPGSSSRREHRRRAAAPGSSQASAGRRRRTASGSARAGGCPRPRPRPACAGRARRSSGVDAGPVGTVAGEEVGGRAAARPAGWRRRPGSRRRRRGATSGRRPCACAMPSSSRPKRRANSGWTPSMTRCWSRPSPSTAAMAPPQPGEPMANVVERRPGGVGGVVRQRRRRRRSARDVDADLVAQGADHAGRASSARR